MKTLTIEELQENFDEYMDKVETGESFLIKSEYGDAILIPYKHYNEALNSFDDVIRIHTDHEEGC